MEIERAGHHLRFRATPVPGPHPRVHELLRAKYGLADRWVRFIGPDNAETLAVRLDSLTQKQSPSAVLLHKPGNAGNLSNPPFHPSQTMDPEWIPWLETATTSS